MDKGEIINYWTKSSDKDFKTMNNLFASKDYAWCLFIGHLVIEKLLKAYYVKHVDTATPHVHNLLMIAEKSSLTLTENQKDFLQTVTRFNIQARYDDFKFEFHQKCSKAFTQEWVEKIKEFREWIKNELMTS
ncbi:DNA-binding protein [Candidatus Desulfarcum epimagneticum]|uniref:DNA-binding protein n=1 Tax=uncultured Desulfobacteraceae bacterium TaxID=218296 RepID=A0A484HHW1_9BACT|nr:DNA-binding protein [uncultured Desulfobacteraceae bacterium]